MTGLNWRIKLVRVGIGIVALYGIGLKLIKKTWSGCLDRYLLDILSVIGSAFLYLVTGQ
jgi:hypothetical protein